EKIKGKVTPVQLEMTSEPDMDALVQLISGSYRKLDVLINNAGVISPDIASKVQLVEVKRVFESNVLGPWKLIQKMIPLLEKSSDGRIINISSGMGSLHD